MWEEKMSKKDNNRRILWQTADKSCNYCFAWLIKIGEDK